MAFAAHRQRQAGLDSVRFELGGILQDLPWLQARRELVQRVVDRNLLTGCMAFAPGLAGSMLTRRWRVAADRPDRAFGFVAARLPSRRMAGSSGADTLLTGRRPSQVKTLEPTPPAIMRPGNERSSGGKISRKCGIQCVSHSMPASTAMKTIQMTIDDRLLKLVDKMSRARKTTRSAFIRDALEAEIRRQHIREEEARHAEGYARKPVAPGEFDVWLNEQDWGTS